MKRFLNWLIFVLLIWLPFSIVAFAQPLKIHFIDVGEGEATLIEAPNAESILIDSGNSISGFKLSGYLKENNIRQLNHLIFTHAHLDHIGGSFLIAQSFPVENVYDNGEDLSGLAAERDIYRWYSELIRERASYRALRVSDQLLAGDLSLEVLWPDKPFLGSDFNINSLVVMIKYKDFRCLLMADATVSVEETLLKADRDLKADVLKVGHHGSGDASSQEFLRAVFPGVSIISVNKNNIRGYPAKEVLARLREVESVVYRTDRDRTVVVTVDEQGKFLVNKENELN